MVAVWMSAAWYFNELNAVLLALLLTVGILCLVGIWWALSNLKLEKSVYDAMQKDDKLQVLYERYLRGEVKTEEGNAVPDFYAAVAEQARQNGVCALGSSTAVQQYLRSLYGSAISRKIHSGYVSDRLYAVLCSVDTENLVKKLPALEDLRELTMQRERGGFSTSCFRLLSPSILVCGILGTLIGVHGCLGGGVHGKAMIPMLADALLPGALAVGITVMVMCFRGWYNSRWAQFVSAFDEYTLRHMLPLFRPSASQVETDIGTLGDAMRQTREQYAQIQRLRDNLQSFQKRIGECHCACAEMLSASRSRLEVDCSDYEQRYLRALRLQEFQKKLVESVDLLQVCYKSLLKRVQSVQTIVLSTGKRSSLLRVLEEVIPPAQQAIHRMDDINLDNELIQVQQMVDDSLSIIEPIDQDALKREDDRMKEIAERLGHLDEVCRKFEAAGQRITQIDNEIDKAIVEGLTPTISRGLPDVIKQLRQNYEIARHAAEPRRKALESFALQQKSEIHTLRLAKDREVKELMNSSQGMSNYPRGWTGFKLRVRDWRLAEGDKWRRYRKIGGLTWGVILAALGVFVVWPAWLIHRANQEKSKTQYFSVERYSEE